MQAGLCAIVVAAGCARSGSTESLPRMHCDNCVDAALTTVATHAELVFSTSWQADCWETAGGVFPVTSDSGHHDSHTPCDKVEHTPALACVGGECKITPLGAAGGGSNAQSFRVVVVSPGRYEIRADLARSHGSRSLTYDVTVARPSRFDATCTVIDDVHSSISITLTHDGETLVKGPPVPEMRAGDARCTALGSDGSQGARYMFDCPVAKRDAIAVTVTGADFAVTQQTTCR